MASNEGRCFSWGKFEGCFPTPGHHSNKSSGLLKLQVRMKKTSTHFWICIDICLIVIYSTLMETLAWICSVTSLSVKISS